MSQVSRLKKKAADLEQKKQLDRALEAYVELLESVGHDIDDADIPLYNKVGDLLSRKSGAHDALTYYEKAVDLYAERGFLNNAIALCNKILRQSPGRSVIYYKLGRISAVKGFKSDAKRNFLEYADRMEKAGKRDEAFRALKEFADLSPDQDDVRLMLADHLARDNRRDEAIEQLQVLHAKLQEEGRTAEARATLDRMKAIDPDVEPQQSGAYLSVKSNDLVFLDLDDFGGANESPSTPSGSRTIESGRVAPPNAGSVEGSPALSGITRSRVEDAARDERAAGIESVDRFTPTGEEWSLTPDDVAPVADVEVTPEFPAPDSFADNTLSESEFGQLQLAAADEGLEPRPHDLALPSDLPLIQFTGEVEAIEPGIDFEAVETVESAILDLELPEAVDIDGEIMSPIAQSAAGPGDAVTEPVAAPVEESQPVPPERAEASPAHDQESLLTVESSVTSLEWEDLAAAAALHDVEPLMVPPSSAPDAAGESEPAAEIDPDFLTKDPTFGGVTMETDPSFAPLPPLSAETLELVGVSQEGVAARGPGAGESPNEQTSAPRDTEAAPQASQEVAESLPARATPPRAQAVRAGVEALREQLAAAPRNAGLRRRYAEALLEIGKRNEGLEELDAAMRTAEERGDLDTAWDIVAEMLRLVPESVRHHQKAVEYAVRCSDRPRLVDAYVALADALFRGGEHEKSEAVYGRVLELEPNEERAWQALQLLSDDAATPPAAPSVEEPPSAGVGEDVLGAEVDAAFAEAAFSESPVASVSPVPTEDGDGEAALAERGDGDFVDLGAWLRTEQPLRSTRMVVDDAKPTGDEKADFDDMLRRFKEGVAANVDEEDFDSHYDLGVAFKEMGLIDDAISQFQKALRSNGHRTRAYEALGQCFVEKDQHQVAATLLARAVETTGADDRELIGTLYLAGYACERLQRHREAVGYYQRVFAVDVDFRDVSERIRSLDPQGT
ncbi:MAG: tetratricopeptide repeat protein [Gemmatimonadaceae bacterium]